VLTVLRQGKMADNMPGLKKELAHIGSKARLSSAVSDVDKMIALLSTAREQIASST
jgi:hypothetical protein